MQRTGWAPIAWLCAAIVGLAAMASGAGVLLRGDLATTEVVTPRGETFAMLTGGVYRWNSLNVASEGVGWDVVTLVVVLPFFALILPALARGSLRAAMAATGVLAYMLYQYFEYATYLAYGPLFLLYVAIFALSLSGIALIVARIGVGDLSRHVSERFPRRGVMGFGIFMAVLLGGMWLPLIASTIGGQTAAGEPVQLYGGTTFVVQAFDLGLLVPLGLFTAAAVWRRHPAGYLLAAVVVVKGIAMGTAIAAMLVFEAIATGEAQFVPIVGFALIALVSLVLAIRVFGGLVEGMVPVGTGAPASAAPAAA